MAQKKKTDIDDERAKLAEAAEQLKKAAEILGNMQSSSEESAIAPSNRSAKPKSASSSKSSTAKKPAAKKATAQKTDGQDSGKPAAKKPAAKKAPAEKAEQTESAPPADESTPVQKPAEKPATKKSVAKKTGNADKPTAEKKPAAKKPTAKKAPAKKAEPVIAAPVDESEPVAEEPKAEPVAETPTEPIAEEPKAEPVAETPTEPIAEEPKAEPVAEAPTEPIAEEPKEEAVKALCRNCGAAVHANAAFCNKCGTKMGEEPKEEPKEEPRSAPVAANAPADEAAATTVRKRGVAAKTDEFIKNKGKLPIFIIINALFLVATIVLLFAAYYDKNGTYNVFQYFSSANSASIKAFLVEQSAGWGGGAYTMLGILMIVAAVIPLVLIIKNITILIVKKDRRVYRLDAIITFAAMLFYISMVNLFGAYIAAGPIVSLIITGLIFVFIIIAQLVERTDKPLPIYSFVMIVLITVTLLTFTYEVYTSADGNKAWCASAASSDIAGPALFVSMLIVVIELIVMLVLQMKSIRGIVGKIIDTLLALNLMGFAILSLVCAGGGIIIMESNPDNISLYGSFIFGGVMAMLLAFTWILFTWIRPLNRVKHTLDTSAENNSARRRRAVVTEDPAPVIETATVPAVEGAETAAQPQAEKPTEEPQYEFCRKCGTKSIVGSRFCKGCGAKID